MKFFSKLLASAALCGALVAAAPSQGLEKRAGTYSQVTNFGSNPSGALMYQYVPTTLKANPAIVVAIHYCTGTAQAYYTGTPYAQLADQYGFVVIYPQSPYSGTCWDVSSQSALTHNGGGDSNSIANMVTWAISNHKADASKVYVTGSSSGAMMTNVMAATYPELFAAASLYSGVPAGCFLSSANQVDAWNSTCANGDIDSTQAYWGSVAKAMYAGYTGARPRMMIYHGTADTTLYPPNYNETIKQWTGVFADSLTPTTTTANTPLPNYTTYTFGPAPAQVVGVYAVGVGHTVPVLGTSDMDWFGISGAATPGVSSSGSGTGTGGGTGSGTGTTTTAPASSPTSGGGGTGTGSGTVAEYGQCGGIGWTGATACVTPYTCHVLNSYYSQCY
ncbi:hypothetical protein MMC10_008017 [Thelotrema lepadinum]|nr:hypothetical protein [Thelotrema lepadinum]